ncbi:MAG: stage III sporulation AC/AD family protein [Oscillospiraceae bacterium]|nr:stage III sporulation AC/AD family protein [Oscillospiraceae bacterium]
MVTALQVAGLSLTAVLLAKVLERYAAEQAMLLMMLLCVGLTAAAVLSLTPILERMDTLLHAGGLSADETARLSKAIGVCIVTELAADTCRDAGEAALATAVTMTGKTTLLLLSLPLVETLLRVMEEVLGCAGG